MIAGLCLSGHRPIRALPPIQPLLSGSRIAVKCRNGHAYGCIHLPNRSMVNSLPDMLRSRVNSAYRCDWPLMTTWS